MPSASGASPTSSRPRAHPREAVVLSACRGVTDALLDLVALAERPEGYIPSAIEQLKRRHEKLAAELLSRAAYETYCTHLNNDCRDIAGVLQTVRLIRSATYSMRDVIAGYGEIWSTRLFAPFLRERGRIQGEVLWVDARQVVIVEWGPLGPAVQWASSEQRSAPAGAEGFQRPAHRDRLRGEHHDRNANHPGTQRQRFFRFDLRCLARCIRDHHLDRCGRRAVGRPAAGAQRRR